jgi:hypothetical protein
VTYNPQFSEFAAANNQFADNTLSGAVDVWNATGQFMSRLPVSDTAWVEGVAFSPSGSEIAAGDSGGDVVVLDQTTGHVIAQLGVGSGTAVKSVEFSPDGASVLAAYTNDKVIDWDLGSKQPERVFTIPGGANDAVFSTDGTDVVATSSLGRAVVWDATTGAQITVLRSNLGPMEGTAFDPARNLVATAGNQGVVSLWYASPHESSVLRSMTLPSKYGPIFEELLDPSTGDVYASTIGGTVAQFDPRSGAVSVMATNTNTAMAVVPGRELVSETAGGTLRAWSLPDLQSVPLTDPPVHVDGLGYAPATRRFYIATSSGALSQAYEGRSLELSQDQPLGKPSDWSSIAFNEAGTQVLMARRSGQLSIFDAASTKLVRNVSVPTIGFEGRLARTIVAEFSSDSTRIVVARTDGSAYVLDARTGSTIARLRVDSGTLLAASFAPKNDDEIVTASANGTARIWDVPSTTQLQVLTDPDQTTLEGATFTHDGSKIVTASDGGSVRVWSVVPSQGALVRQATAKIDHVASPWVRNSLMRSS